MQIRRVQITFAAAEKMKKNKYKEKLIQHISEMKMECNSKNNDQHSPKKLENLIKELIELRKKQTRGNNTKK